MFPFFNKDFFKSVLNGQKELKMKSPNGAVYRFSTNAIDNEEIKQLENELQNLS